MWQVALAKKYWSKRSTRRRGKCCQNDRKNNNKGKAKGNKKTKQFKVKNE